MLCEFNPRKGGKFDPYSDEVNDVFLFGDELKEAFARRGITRWDQKDVA